MGEMGLSGEIKYVEGLLGSDLHIRRARLAHHVVAYKVRGEDNVRADRKDGDVRNGRLDHLEFFF